ncbi:hypothetical protein amrb99_17260 [Actinomadura sp. RB99]|nr:hypothetical protein [Actinomadura sp. RB99]
MAMTAASGMLEPLAVTTTTPPSGLLEVFTRPRSCSPVRFGPCLLLTISAARAITGVEPANAARCAVYAAYPCPDTTPMRSALLLFVGSVTANLAVAVAPLNRIWVAATEARTLASTMMRDISR